MQISIARRIKLTAIAVLAGALLGSMQIASGSDRDADDQLRSLRIPSEPFSPSNARTADGNFIPEAQFFPAARCIACHQDTHTAWAESLHRNAAREPFYKESVDILLRAQGIEFTRHCESCHGPVALFSGALTKDSKQTRAMDDEGVTCSVCHSITEARLDGTGSYTIRRPALLAREDGTPIFGDLPDAQILSDVAGHRRAMMRPLLKEPEFCATCHKSTAPPELNGYKFIRGFSAYDEWQQSGASHETVTPFYRREQRADCRACHMPKIASQNDLAAKNNLIASHRWLGANTAAPLFYGQARQAEMTEDFLKANVLGLDIFTVRSESSGVRLTELSATQANSLAVSPGEEVTAEVVVSNRNAGHSFPPELRDMYEAWVEFEAIDATGKTIYRSGYLHPDGTLDESAHVYKAVLLDESARMITRHQVWVANIKAYDNAIPPGRSDVARFRFRLPTDEPPAASTRLTFRARVKYRRFTQEYIDYVLTRRKAQLVVPAVTMVEAQVQINANPAFAVQTSSNPQLADSAARRAMARRWNDYGIGLLEQAQYGEAAVAFWRASECNPAEPNHLVNAAIAEMKTERFGPERLQLANAAALLDCALTINPEHARARFYRALVLRSEGKPREAAEGLLSIARAYPRDREVQRQLGQTLYGLGRLKEAGTAFEALLAIDPTDAGAYQFLAPIYASRGQQAEADRTRALYLAWRDDPRADSIAARFYAAHPEWAEERISKHSHSRDSTRRPILSGRFAAP